MRLPDLAELKGALERLVAGCSDAEDSGHIEEALSAGALAIATGDRAVTFGGSGDGAVVVTGDGNVVLHLDASGIGALYGMLKGSRPSLVHQLPADIAGFAGRQRQLMELQGTLSALGGHAAITVIDGMGGLGKTALAVHAAHRVVDLYPDGQIIVDMAGTGAPLSPAQGLARVIRAFEPEMQLPEVAADLRPIYLSVLHGKRVLLILDNALDGDQVALLVPPERCALVVTARGQIALPGSARIDLDLLAPAEAVGLLRLIVGNGRATETELSQIAGLCGFLPLALRVAGMFLVASPHWSAVEFIATLADERQRLGRLRLEGNAELNVAASLALSVRELRGARPNLVDQWHELAAFPDGFQAIAAAAVWNQPMAAARDALGLLLSRSMVLYDPSQRRWRLHDLMRDLAAGHAAVDDLGARADLEARLAEARRRHAEHYYRVLATAEHSYTLGGEHVVTGLALFDRERRNIETGQAWAVGCAVGDPVAARLCVYYPDAGQHVLTLRQHPRQRIAWLEPAIAAARSLGDRGCEGAALHNLARAYEALSEPRRAIALYEEALIIARELGNQLAEGASLSNLGNAYMALGEVRRAIEFYEEHLPIARAIGDRRGEGNTLGNLGVAYRNLGQARRAIEFHEQRLAIAREIGDRQGEAVALGGLGLAFFDLGETRRAIEHYEQALVISQSLGDRRAEAKDLGNLGLAFGRLGQTGRAIGYLKQQLGIAQEIGDRQSQGNALGGLGLAYAILGETDRAVEYQEQHLRIARDIGDQRGEAAALNHLGDVEAALGNTAVAIQLLGEALEIFSAIGSPYAQYVREKICKLNMGTD